MYIKEYLALNNQQSLICHKTNQPTNQPYSRNSFIREIICKLQLLHLSSVYAIKCPRTILFYIFVFKVQELYCDLDYSTEKKNEHVDLYTCPWGHSNYADAYF